MSRSYIISFAVFFVAAILLFSSCKKENSVDGEVQITILNPKSGDVFQHGDTIQFSVEVEADFELHGYSLRLLNQSNDNELVFGTHSHSHDTRFTLSHTWVNNVEDHSDMRFEVEIVRSHSEGDRIEKHVHFHCHPE